MIAIRSFTPLDLEFGLKLSRQAGWNQTRADWTRCLHLQPEGCFVATYQDTPVGTLTCCLFGQVAWVAMVLVEHSFRRRGIGRALMEHALAFLDAHGVYSIRLDATPLGQPLYEQLGFSAQFELVRYAGILPRTQPPSTSVLVVPPEHWHELFSLDFAITHTDRSRFLRALFAENPNEVRAIQGAQGWLGFLTTRQGSLALMLGPCLGEAGERLLQDACHRHAGARVFLDVPLGHLRAEALTQSWGLTEQRRLLRMTRGVPLLEATDLLWTSSGPEKG